MTKITEIRALTSLRGVAAMLVAFYHFRTQFGDAIQVDQYTSFFRLGYLWVDFFFVLSGFVLMHVYAGDFKGGVNRTSYAAFMLRRLGRIYPLHLFMLVCFIPTEGMKFVIPSDAYPPFSNNTPFSILTNVLLVQAWNLHSIHTWNTPSWTISAEFAAYLLFPFWAWFLQHFRPASLIAIALVTFGLLYGLMMTVGHGRLGMSLDYGVLRCLPSVTLGMLIARWHGGATSGLLKAVMRSDAALGTTLIAVAILMHSDANHILIVLAFCLLVCAASLNMSFVGQMLSWEPLRWLGVLSYSIYMTHGLVLRVWQLVFQKVFHSAMTTATALAMCCVLLGVILCVSALTYRCIEQPGRRAFNGLAMKWTARARTGQVEI